MSDETLTYRAFAKVNLTLEILGRRPDGFHEIASLAHTISLADVLEVAPSDSLTCEVAGMHLPDEDNLVARAARSVSRATGASTGARVRLEKRIPESAGLGGGSSDAAAAITALRRLWRVRLGPGPARALLADLGSDVPFFRRGGAALLRGRGDLVEAVPLARQWLVLIVPPHVVPDKTRTLYAALRPSDFSDGGRSLSATSRLQQGKSLRDVDLVNAFDRAARETFPGLAALWTVAVELAGRPFHLSGAGPALFALASGAPDARRAADALRTLSHRVYVVRTVGRGHALVRTPYP